MMRFFEICKVSIVLGPQYVASLSKLVYLHRYKEVCTHIDELDNGQVEIENI